MNSVRNVLAIADKELRSYFASPIAYIIIGLFALHLRPLLRRLSPVLRAAQLGDGPDGRRLAQHQPGHDPLPADELRGDHPLRHADDHDADLRRRKTVGHDRAAADLAAHRSADHPRQVPRRHGPLRRDARGDAAAHGHPVLVRQSGVAADRRGLPGVDPDGRLLHFAGPADLQLHEEPDRGRRHHLRGVPDAVDHQLERRAVGTDGRGRSSPISRSSITSTISPAASSTPST